MKYDIEFCTMRQIFKQHTLTLRAAHEIAQYGKCSKDTTHEVKLNTIRLAFEISKAVGDDALKPFILPPFDNAIEFANTTLNCKDLQAYVPTMLEFTTLLIKALK